MKNKKSYTAKNKRRAKTLIDAVDEASMGAIDAIMRKHMVDVIFTLDKYERIAKALNEYERIALVDLIEKELNRLGLLKKKQNSEYSVSKIIEGDCLFFERLRDKIKG